jgi:hypothetical protein
MSHCTTRTAPIDPEDFGLVDLGPGNDQFSRHVRCREPRRMRYRDGARARSSRPTRRWDGDGFRENLMAFSGLSQTRIGDSEFDHWYPGDSEKDNDEGWVTYVVHLPVTILEIMLLPNVSRPLVIDYAMQARRNAEYSQQL